MALWVVADGARAQATLGESFELTTRGPRFLSAARARVATDGARYFAAWSTSEETVYVTSLDAAGRTLGTPRATLARCASIDLAWSGSHWLLACTGRDAPTLVLRLAPDGTGGETAATFPPWLHTPTAELDCGPSRCALALRTPEEIVVADLASDGTPLGELRRVASGVRFNAHDVCVSPSYTLVVWYDDGVSPPSSFASAVRRSHAGAVDLAFDAEVGRGARCAARDDVFALVGQTHVVVLGADGTLGAAQAHGVLVGDPIIASLSRGWMLTARIRELGDSASEIPVVARTLDATGTVGSWYRLSTRPTTHFEWTSVSLACTSERCVSVFVGDADGAHARAHDASGPVGGAEHTFSIGVPVARHLGVVSDGCEATLSWAESPNVEPTLVADVDARAPFPATLMGDRGRSRVPAARGPSATLWRGSRSGGALWSVEQAGVFVDSAHLGPDGVPLVLGDGFAVLAIATGLTGESTQVWEVRLLDGEVMTEPRSATLGPAVAWTSSGSAVALIVGAGSRAPQGVVYLQPGAPALGPFTTGADMPTPRAIACRESACLLADATVSGITLANAGFGEGPGPARTISLIDTAYWRPLELIAVGAGYLLAQGDRLIALDASGEPVGSPVDLPDRGALFVLDSSRALVSSEARDAVLRAHVVTIGSTGAPPRCVDAPRDGGVALDAGTSGAPPTSCACRVTGLPARARLGGLGWAATALLLAGIVRRRR